MLKPLLISALETALNQYLSLDEDVSLFLAPLAGKVIAVKVLPFNETVYLCPTETNIQILDQYINQPDTIISGSPTALGLMSLSATPMHSVFTGKVHIEGDMDTGRHFQALFDKLDIDMEEKLSHYTGDIVAHQIGRFFRNSSDWSQESIETFKLNLTEFLQEETRDLPSRPEIDIFFQQVDRLRSDYDRLNARLDRLNQILAEKTP